MLNHIKEGRFDLGIKRILLFIAPANDIRSKQILAFCIKRTSDILLSSLILLLMAIPMLIVIIVIKIDSPGSAFFSQTRVGLKGKPFKLFKFRTMVHDAAKIQNSLEQNNEIKGGVLFKIKQDPRITKPGRFLRRYSIDEIPQLINVLRGEMSLVGPRPLTLRDASKLPAEQLARTEVLPGITGFWQVSGRSETCSDHLGKCDLLYIKKWSLSLDLFILLKTVSVVLSGEGAY